MVFSPGVSFKVNLLENWKAKKGKKAERRLNNPLIIFKCHWRRKYLWNQLISRPPTTAKASTIPILKFIHHQHFQCFIVRFNFFLFTISKNYLNEQKRFTSLFRHPAVNEKSRKTLKSDSFNAFPFVENSNLNIEIYCFVGVEVEQHLFAHEIEICNFTDSLQEPRVRENR